ELLEHAPVGAQERVIRRRAVENRLIDAAQKELRVALGPPPEIFVEAAEQHPARRVPAEPEIRGELREPRDLRRQPGRHLQRVLSDLRSPFQNTHSFSTVYSKSIDFCSPQRV